MHFLQIVIRFSSVRHLFIYLFIYYLEGQKRKTNLTLTAVLENPRLTWSNKEKSKTETRRRLNLIIQIWAATQRSYATTAAIQLREGWVGVLERGAGDELRTMVKTN